MASAQNLHVGAFLCGSQDFKALNLKESQEPNFLTRDTLFEMKLTLSSEASSMLPELNFK
jgi:hypothetical protein